MIGKRRFIALLVALAVLCGLAAASRLTEIARDGIVYLAALYQTGAAVAKFSPQKPADA